MSTPALAVACLRLGLDRCLGFGAGIRYFQAKKRRRRDKCIDLSRPRRWAVAGAVAGADDATGPKASGFDSLSSKSQTNPSTLQFVPLSPDREEEGRAAADSQVRCSAVVRAAHATSDPRAVRGT